MEESKSGNYVSCIQVKGINLLPPVITEKRRVELQRYKQQAVKLEKRLQNCRQLRKNLDELLNYQPLSDRPQSALTFGDNSHIEALGISESSRAKNKKRTVCLSKDIVDVSEYNNNCIKIINKKSSLNDINLNQGQSLNSSNGQIETEEHSLSILSEITSFSPHTTNNEQFRLSDIKDFGELHVDVVKYDLSPRECSSSPNSSDMFQAVTSPKPRLIRSNSYILETPSPILLAHLQKNKDNRSEVNKCIVSRNWSSLENNYVPFENENSEFSSINTVCHIDDLQHMDNNQIPKIEVIETDISFQHLTVNTENDKNTIAQNIFDLSNTDSQLMQVLQEIPEDYSKQIIELIEKQNCDNVKDTVNIENELNKKNKINYETSELFSGYVPPCHSVYYSISSVGTLIPNSPSLKQINFDRDNDQYEIFESGLKQNFGREPFPNTTNIIKEEWAASIIGAYVRGYLTRRLLKTHRVQSLIQTIKDTLLCALQLHTAENIDKSDVELHRRLINQVSVACYAFHDIFFSLSISEQMSVISLDRQRKIEKSKRPLSAPTPRTSHSTSTRSVDLTPYSHSFTKV